MRGPVQYKMVWFLLSLYFYLGQFILLCNSLCILIPVTPKSAKQNGAKAPIVFHAVSTCLRIRYKPCEWSIIRPGSSVLVTGCPLRCRAQTFDPPLCWGWRQTFILSVSLFFSFFLCLSLSHHTSLLPIRVFPHHPPLSLSFLHSSRGTALLLQSSLCVFFSSESSGCAF